MSELSLLYEKEAQNAAKDLLPSVLNSMRENIERFAETMRVIREEEPRRILDVGCHLGLLGALLRWNHGYKPERIVGIDWSPTACGIAVANFGYDRAICANIEDWTPDEEFDCVIATEIIEHLRAPMMTVQKICNTAPLALFSFPIENGEPDGVIHRRIVTAQDVFGWVGERIRHAESWIVPSAFSEKPHWMGQVFVRVVSNQRKEELRPFV